jgi:small subunit ribosomal protein S20
VANIKSAKKRILISRVRTLRNASLKSALRTSIKKFEVAAKTDREQAQLALTQAVQALDKAVTKGILHKNAAARKKSRLTKKFNSLAS